MSSVRHTKRNTQSTASLTNRRKALFCKICADRGLDAESRTHNPRDKDRITCPILKKQVCSTCGECGHVSKSSRCQGPKAPPVRLNKPQNKTPPAPKKLITNRFVIIDSESDESDDEDEAENKTQFEKNYPKLCEVPKPTAPPPPIRLNKDGTLRNPYKSWVDLNDESSDGEDLY